MCVQGKIPLETSLDQMGKQLHAGPIKPEPGFCGSSFGFFQRVRGRNLISTFKSVQYMSLYMKYLPRPLPVPLDKGNAGSGDEIKPRSKHLAIITVSISHPGERTCYPTRWHPETLTHIHH